VLLSKVVSELSDQDFTDAYSGSFAFSGKISKYNGSVRDSMTGDRRTVSVPACYSKPARNAVAYSGFTYLTGDVIEDYSGGTALKKHIILQPAYGLASVGSSAEILSGVGLTQLYAGLAWRKSQKEEHESSELFNLFNIYVSEPGVGARNSVVSLGNKYFRIQGIEESTGGFIILVSSELEDDAVQSVSYTPASGTYDPVTDTLASSSSFTLNAFVERFQTTYRYTNKSNEKFVPGDLIVTFSKADVASPKPGDIVTVNSVEFELVSAYDDSAGAWEAHLRV